MTNFIILLLTTILVSLKPTPSSAVTCNGANITCIEPATQAPAGCLVHNIYSTPDDCGCLHWHCKELPAAVEKAVCPSGWTSYTNSLGAAFCIKLVTTEVTWLRATLMCNEEDNSDLFNAREFELFAEGNSTLYDSILHDMATITDQLPHWSGLHMIQDKLYWDNAIPAPDRDWTSNRNFGYDRASQSIVQFNSAQWTAFQSGRYCVSYKSQALAGPRAIFQPEYCSARFPFVCAKHIPADVETFYKPSDALLCGGEEGWVGSTHSGMCYKYFTDLVPFAEAQRVCQLSQGGLADPRTELKQRFLVGMLEGLPNGVAPLATHVGMQQLASQQLQFPNGDLLRVNQLAAESILTQPTTVRQCGVFNNPFFAEQRLETGLVQFGDCARFRPIICTRDFSSQSVSDVTLWNVTVVRNGYTLTCNTMGLESVSGVFVWKKDHQYFPKQNNSQTLSLTSEEYKYMIDDHSNRVIGHGELAGVYACELWQTFPAAQYKSSDLSVTFNDSTSLRMSTILNETRWSTELEAFNHRVSHMDELTPQVQVVYDQLLTIVQFTLTPFSSTSVEYGINILSLSRALNNRVNVDYRITLSGEEIAASHTGNVSTKANADVLDNILNTLSTSELSNDETHNTPIEGQFTCLQRTLTHPQTLVNLTLPRKPDGTEVAIPGDCKGRITTMLTAKCLYNQDTRISTWSSIAYTNCSVSCLSHTVTHSVSKESFLLFNADEGQVQKFSGACGRDEQEMFSAVCSNGAWRVTELECVLMCLPRQFNHLQWPELLPGEEVPVNSTYKVDMLCDASNKTILTARCELNPERTDGVWRNIVIEMCEVTCEPKRIVHPAGRSWNMSTSSLGYEVELMGQCDGRTMNLGSATCDGDLSSGAFWNVSLSVCQVSCSPKTFTHLDTEALIALDTRELGETVVQNLSCNGQRLPVEAECVGSLSLGAEWVLKNTPPCAPVCPQTEWYDPVTDKTYTVEAADFLAQSAVSGFCGGDETTLMVANCAGDISNGVLWELEIFNCTPSCDVTIVQHPDTQANLSLPIASYNKLASLSGSCNGNKHTALVTATCGGDITSAPEWTNVKFETCVGYCESVTVTFNDVTREPATLRTDVVGDRVSINGTCALLSFVEVTAECVGNAADGGEWNYTVHRCDVDTTCPLEAFVHPDTKSKLVARSSEVDTTVAVSGKCHGNTTILMNVTCQPVVGGRGDWVNEVYAPCNTDFTDQLNNLFENFKDDPLKLASLTASMSENLDNSTDEVISLLVDIVEFVADPNTAKAVESEGEFFFDIIDNMMNVDLGAGNSAKSADAMNGTSSGNRLAKSVEGFLDSASLNSSHIKLNRTNLLVEVIDISLLGTEGDPEFTPNDKLAVSLPQSLVNGSKLSFVKYASPAMFSNSKTVLGDTVFSASLSDKTVNGTDGAITFVMQMSPNDTAGDRIPVCSYWNFSISDWSSDGCAIVDRTNSSVTCSCNHLTNFAILMDIEGQKEYIPPVHHTALSIISMIGLGISSVALILHLISFIFIVKLRQNQFQKVLANLVFAILASNLVFMIGIDKVGNPTACIAVAALLHYFILASFCWMFVEAFMQYRRFVKVLGTHVSYVLVKAGIPGWLVPAIPVSIVFIIDPQLYKGGDKFCWMKSEALYYSFLLPVGLVIIANIVLFSLILRGLTCARAAKLRTNKSEREQRLMYFKAGLAVFTLLGMTWVFGFFAIKSARLVFQYIFCITNAFQGLILFLLHNIRHPKVVAFWRSLLHLEPIPGGSTFRASSSTYLSKKTDYSRSASVDDFEANKRRMTYSKNKSGPINVSNGSISASVATDQDLTNIIPKKYVQLENSKLMHSSTESESSSSQTSAESTATGSSEL